jgi:hypothetical protein
VVFSKDAVAPVVKAGGKDVRLGGQSAQHLRGGVLIVEGERCSGIRSQRIGKRRQLVDRTGPVAVPLINCESDGGQQDRQRAGGQDEERQVNADREIPNTHRFRALRAVRRRSQKLPGAAGGS